MTQEIQWLDDWQQAQDQAKAQDRPIWLDFFLPT